MNRTDAQIGYRRINPLGMFFPPRLTTTPSVKRWKQARCRAARSIGQQHHLTTDIFS